MSIKQALGVLSVGFGLCNFCSRFFLHQQGDGVVSQTGKGVAAQHSLNLLRKTIKEQVCATWRAMNEQNDQAPGLDIVLKQKGGRPFYSNDEVFAAMQVQRAPYTECDRRLGHLHLSTFQFIATRLMERYANFFAFYNVVDLTFTSAPDLPELWRPKEPKRHSDQLESICSNAKGLLRNLRDINVPGCSAETCGSLRQLALPMKERGVHRYCSGCSLKFAKAKRLMIGSETPSELWKWLESQRFESVVVPVMNAEQRGDRSRSWQNQREMPDYRVDRGRGPERGR